MSEQPWIVPQPAYSEHPHRAEIEIKRSRFITLLWRADSEAQAREHVAAARAEYPDARHHCSAFIITQPGSTPIERSSDDGEPAGTAGQPMLETLRGSGISNICAIVVRYFGGIKLGTGGLVRAYGDAVTAGLDTLTTARRDQMTVATAEFDHSAAGKAEADLRGRGWELTNVDYGAHVTIEVAFPPEQQSEFEGTIAALTGGAQEPTIIGERWVETNQR